MMPGEAGPLQERGVSYSTTLPAGSGDWRRSLGYTVSAILHVVLLIFVVRATQQRQAETAQRATTEETIRPIQLDFAPPRPTPTPRPVEAPKDLPPAVPLTPGQQQDPGSIAQVTPTPEQEPNAPPATPLETATRPNPSHDDAPEASARASAPPAPSAVAAPLAPDAAPSMEADARRIFGRPSSKLGPLSGARENRPWESPYPMPSEGCSLPPEEHPDSTLPPGMASIAGRVYYEGTSVPVAGARLQILGTAYGTFANDRGEYRLIYASNLVDRCRTAAVRVTAAGYSGRDLILHIGAGSTDVPLPRY
ncbi:MAG: hypothetical protein ABI742_10630 [Gemmatimonadota bacterium]